MHKVAPCLLVAHNNARNLGIQILLLGLVHVLQPMLLLLEHLEAILGMLAVLRVCSISAVATEDFFCSFHIMIRIINLIDLRLLHITRFSS